MQDDGCWFDWKPTPFLVYMAVQRYIHPLGILKGVVIDVVGIKFVVSFVVLSLEYAVYEYNLLLGRLSLA